VRHGETEWNSLRKIQGREDIPLNTTGVKQIKETANYLKNFNWEVIISSPLLRAKNSAEIITKKIGKIEIIEEFDFIEKDYGKASGMTTDETKVYFPNGIWPGVELFEKIQNRTVNALTKYVQKYDGNNIIIVSHGAAINSILSYLSGSEIGTGKSNLKNACMTLLKKIDSDIKIVYFNKIADDLINIV